MAINGLPDITFTNNLGSISFQRCLVGVIDNWVWNGSAVKHSKQVHISGHVQQQIGGTSEGLENALTTNGGNRGQMGSLLLPWTTLTNVKLMEISYPTDVWIEIVPVTATFQDDRPDNNIYTIHFFGYELHNPRISMPIPFRRPKDEFPQLKWVQNGILDVTEPTQYYMRTRSAYEMMTMQLSGSILLDDGHFPTALLTTLSHRVNVPLSMFLPAGYPQPFNMVDAIPELASSMPFAQLIITESRAVWDVEKESIQLSVTMTCQPQQLVLS